MDSIPIVVITGQVATHLIGSDAFQEADTVGLTRHCTKHNYLVKDPAKVGPIVAEAFHIATSGRPGPVVIDLPKDVRSEEHTSELQSLMRISYAVFCLKKKITKLKHQTSNRTLTNTDRSDY